MTLKETILIVTLLISESRGLNFEYLKQLTKIDLSNEPISPRFIPKSKETWVPNDYEHLNNFYFGDCWYSNEEETFLVPLFRNNRFVIRYFLRPKHGKTVNQTWTETQQKMIRDAITEVESTTCLRFMVLPIEMVRKCGWKLKFRIQFRKHPLGEEKGCYANLGRNDFVPSTEITIDEGCTQGQILHEILHALGFIHEHQRPDRDKYVTIVPKRPAGKDDDYEKYNIGSKFNMKIDKKAPKFEYDYNSIMHYTFSTFIVPKNKAVQKPNREHLTQGDKQKLWFYYGCHRYFDFHYSLKNHSHMYYSDHADVKSGYKPFRKGLDDWTPPTDVPVNFTLTGC